MDRYSQAANIELGNVLQMGVCIPYNPNVFLNRAIPGRDNFTVYRNQKVSS